MLPAHPLARNARPSFASALAALLFAGTLALTAQPAGSAETAQATDTAALVTALARELADNFVFPDVGQRYAAAMQAKLASGAYAGISDPATLAQTITADLQAVAKDGHLKLFTPAMLADHGPRPQGTRPAITAIPASGWLADGVAYIGFNLFPGDEGTLKALDGFIATHAGARVLIIDARTHRGGGLDEMDRIFRQLYARETPLVLMDTRAAVEQRGRNPIDDSPSVRRQQAPAGVVRRLHLAMPAAKPVWQNTKVYLLTSGRTASAAEHLALSLKRTGRATLVGETTRGAGHYGGMAELPGGYGAFIPVGRTFDPDTGQGWEGTGVAPDVQVPAADALDKALELAGVTPAQRRPLAGVS
jgi:hypothetical protein